MNNLSLFKKHNDGPLMTPWSRLFEDMLDTRLSDDFPGFGTGWIPAVDVEETADDYLIRAEMPGLQKEDVKISMTENILTISGEKKGETKTDKKRYHRLERTYGSFQRSFSLPRRSRPIRSAPALRTGSWKLRSPRARKVNQRKLILR